MILLGGVSRMVDGCKLAPVAGAWQTLARRVTHFRNLHLAQCHGTNFPVGPQGLDYVDDTICFNGCCMAKKMKRVATPEWPTLLGPSLGDV